MVALRSLGVLALSACGFEVATDGVDAAPPDVPDLCRNGVIDPGETCDDGGQVAGDGCDVRCAIEPRFVCSGAGACKPVVGLSTALADALPTAGGSTGGSPFNRPCPAGEVLVGFEGHRTNDNMNVGRTRSKCAAITFGTDGRATWSNPSNSEWDANDNNSPALTLVCAQDEIAVGFTPNVIGPAGFVSGWRLLCQPLAHTGGVLSFGTAHPLASYGPSLGQDRPTVQCAAGQGIGGHSGRAGAAYDTVALRCATLAPVICGDGTETPPETCDDGNLLDTDGCSSRCGTP